MTTPSTSSAVTEHRQQADERLKIAILIISDTRKYDTDTSGQYLEEAITTAGHTVLERRIVTDDPEAIEEALQTYIQSPAQVILSSGGTGIAGRDNTVSIVTKLITKPLPGFGELFRMVSFEEIGAAAMLTRAQGGLAGDTLIFALPGSRNAVKTAWKKLLSDELPHMVYEVFKQR